MTLFQYDLVNNFVPLESTRTTKVFVYDLVFGSGKTAVWVISDHSFECGLADSELSDEKTSSEISRASRYDNAKDSHHEIEILLNSNHKKTVGKGNSRRQKRVKMIKFQTSPIFLLSKPS